MSIRPVVTNGMIQRTQDVGIIKQQEDDKPVVQQHHLSIRQEKQEDQLTHQVQQANEKENEGYRYDAKEKGNNKYEPLKKKKKKKQDAAEAGQEPDHADRVLYKGRTRSFDIKI
ncbi:MAG: hypothetical protein HFI35_10765 [Roseburia sp.]|jgi:hypothetical protein|nr:hypothetical protein [Roseburia sp.]